MNFERKISLYNKGVIPVPIEEELLEYKKWENHKGFLKFYFKKVDEYYKGLQEYINIIKDGEKEVSQRQKTAQVFIDKRMSVENLQKQLALKNKLVKFFELFRMKIYAIYEIAYIDNKSDEYKKFKEDFEKIMKIEETITASIILVERRNNVPDGWRNNVDIDINIYVIYILKLELLKHNNDILNIPLNKIEEKLNFARQRLDRLKRIRALKMNLEQEARKPRVPVHINNGVLPTHFKGDKAKLLNKDNLSDMPPTIIAARQSTPSFPFPAPNPQAASAVSRISRTPRTSQKPTTSPTTPLTLEELRIRTNELLKAAKVPDDIRVNPAQSPARRRLSGLPPLAPAAPNRGKIRPHIRPLPKGAPELLAQVMPSRSHSFKSNSPPNDEKPEFDIVSDKKGTPEVYLIDAVNDGLCFLNAIFDYLLYSGKLSIMYERLSAIENLILKQDKYKNDISYIQQIRDVAFKKIGITKIYDPLEELLIQTAIDKDSDLEVKKEKGQLIRLKDDERLKFIDNQDKVEHLGHPKGKDKKDDYEKQRLIFAKSMKYMVALYILSYGKKKFSDIITYAIKNTLFIDVEGEADPYRNEWNQKLLDYYHANYYTFGNEIYRKTDGAVATPEDIADFVYQYVFEYMDDNGFFANQTLITMFKKILFKKIKNTEGENIPRFWLEFATSITEYQDLRATTIFDRVLNKYRFKTLPNGKYIHKDDKYDNYISLLCDQNRTHYLLFLLKSELKYDVVDKPTGGGKPKRPKTAAKSKPKRPKTAAKPK
jgi:hypothetical protein